MHVYIYIYIYIYIIQRYSKYIPCLLTHFRATEPRKRANAGRDHSAQPSIIIIQIIITVIIIIIIIIIIITIVIISIRCIITACS